MIEWIIAYFWTDLALHVASIWEHLVVRASLEDGSRPGQE
jgi:hypothetical protein